MSGAGFALFATAIGRCGIAWSEHALLGVQLPESSAAGTRVRLLRGLPELRQAKPPPWVQLAIARIQALLNGVQDDLADLPLDMEVVPPFAESRRDYDRALATKEEA